MKLPVQQFLLMITLTCTVIGPIVFLSGSIYLQEIINNVFSEDLTKFLKRLIYWGAEISTTGLVSIYAQTLFL